MRAVVVERGSAAEVREVADPVAGEDVLVDVLWSSLNYKDGLALAGNPGVAKISPLVPGIDVVGRVVDAGGSRWAVGDEVVLTGAGLGETRWGGYADRALLPADALVRVPAALGARRAAAIGTAGFTAAQAVLALERYAASSFSSMDGPVLVTGAAGGLGSIAVALLAASGREVVAVTGRRAEEDRLRALGASDVLDRATLAEPGKPLQAQRWAGAIDAVGGVVLANLLGQLRYGGAVAACGNASGIDLAATVLPFILRGVALLGVNSVDAPLPEREATWARLTRDLDPALLDASTRELGIDGVVEAGSRILNGLISGRVVIRVGA